MIASFIIPAYNASKYIVRCLDSIYSLCYPTEDYEVIVIDDCSTDNTIEIVQECQNLHGNLILLTQPYNNRQGAARNRGVAIAKGQYVVFVDSDDIIVPTGIESALSIANCEKLDMCCMNYAKVDQQGAYSYAKVISFEGDGLFSGVQLQTKYPYWAAAPWAYVYNAQFLRQTNRPFEEGVLFEDSDFVQVHLHQAKKMNYSSELAYLALYNETSTTRKISYQRLADYVLLGTRMLDFYNSINDQSAYGKSIEEGGLYNIGIALKRLPKLNSSHEVSDFYNRIDSKIMRNEYICYKYPDYLPLWWIQFALRHSVLTKTLLSIYIPIRAFVKRIKNAL